MKKRYRTRSVARRLLNYFLKGLLFCGPIIITFYLIIYLLKWTDGLIPVNIPGLGIVIVISFITMVGYFGSGILSKPVFDLFDDVLSKTPGLNRIYNVVKDMIEAMVGDKRTFKEPVLVELSSNGVAKIGFVTQKDLSSIAIEGYVAVYFPHSYAISGDLYMVQIEKLKPIQSNHPLLPFIMSGGVAEFDEDNDHKK